MIRRSTGIGAAALVLSLVLHFFGISLTFSTGSPPAASNSAAETVEMGDAFDELAEFRAEPVAPEPVEPPEPPVETQPEPEEAEVPTSQALVASPNPRQTPVPDTGMSQPVEPNTSGPVSPDTGDTPDPEIVPPSGGTDSGQSDARLTPPVTTDTQISSPLGDPAGDPAAEKLSQDAPPTAVPPVAAEPTPPTIVSPAPAIIAALPPETVSPTPETVPSPSDLTGEETDIDESAENSITTSLRPPTRPELPASLPQGTADGTSDQSDSLQAPSTVIESPLTAYARDGTNLFVGQRGGRRSGSQSFGNGRGPGNSDVTNYAGRVFVHLNGTPPIQVSVPGWARVVFRINPDGTLASVDIIDGTRTPEVDRAAKAQIRRAVPFPRPPDGKVRLLSFIYQIRQ